MAIINTQSLFVQSVQYRQDHSDLTELTDGTSCRELLFGLPDQSVSVCVTMADLNFSLKTSQKQLLKPTGKTEQLSKVLSVT